MTSKVTSGGGGGGGLVSALKSGSKFYCQLRSCKTCHLFTILLTLLPVAVSSPPVRAMSFFSSATSEPERMPTGGAANLDLGNFGSLGFNVNAASNDGGSQQGSKSYQQQQQQQEIDSTGASGFGGANANFNANLNGLGNAQVGGQIDLSNLVSLGLQGANPAFAPIQSLLPNTYQGISSDLHNGYNMLTSGVGQQFGSLQSSVQNSMDGGMERIKRFQQNLANRFVDNEEMMLRLYEMALNPEQMCRNLISQTQKNYQQASQNAQDTYSNANQQMNNLLSSASNQFNSVMNTTPNDVVNQVQMQAQPATQQVQSLIKRFGFGK